MSFVIGPYRAVEHPGAGRRAAADGLWRGEDVRTVDEVAMTVLPVECAEVAAGEVAAARAILHDHLLPVTDVVQDDQRVAVVAAWPRAGRLAELVGRRGWLTVGETATVLVPLASALAAVHADGGRHGGVCPESIWFDSLGRPLLGAVAASRSVAAVNDGLPPGCRDVAPEVVRGERLRRGSVTGAADVFSLGSVALFCLTGRSAWPADDPADVLVQSAAGLWPDPPDDAGPPEVLGIIRSMLLADPGRRPGAMTVADRLAAIAEPVPIQFTGPAPAESTVDRWRGWDRSTDREDPGIGAPDGVPADARQPAEVSDPRQPGAARPRPGPRVRLGIAVLCGLLITLVAATVGAWWTGWDDPRVPTSAGAADPSEPNWSQIVGDLDAARGRALVAADAGLLTEVYVGGSAAIEADTATIEKLAQRGWHVVDGVHRIAGVTVQDTGKPLAGSVSRSPPGTVTGSAASGRGAPSGTAASRSGPSGTAHPGAADTSDTPGLVRLVVVDSLPSYAIVDGAGTQVGRTAGRDEERRILTLTSTDRGYRISAVEPG